MILGLIKAKLQDVNHLLDYFKENKIKNTPLFMVLFDNLEVLAAANKVIDKAISPELSELDKKVFDLTISYRENKDNKPIEGDIFQFGLSLLSDEERTKREELIKEYEADMLIDRDIDLIPISRELLNGVDLEVDEYNQIRFFFDPSNWAKKKESVDEPKKKKKLK